MASASAASARRPAAAALAVHELDQRRAAAVLPFSAPCLSSARLVEAQLVAPAVLRGGVLDVGDPLAVAVGVVHRLAAGHALLLHGHRVVEEPLELQLGLSG